MPGDQPWTFSPGPAFAPGAAAEPRARALRLRNAAELALGAVDRSAGLALCWRPTALGDSVQPPLGVDPDAYAPADFDALADHLQPVERLIDAAPADSDGMRWRYLDDAILFGCERELAVPFDEFTSRVDVSRAISLTNGYLGGCTSVLERDGNGRATRQIERSVNRTQPAYLALFGADALDVCKLQTVTYSDDEHRLRWRQIHSPNGSAVCDDGSVAFRRSEGGGTQVSIRTWQQFTLPPLWRAISPTLWPVVKRTLVEHAYRSSFAATLDSIEECSRPAGSAPKADAPRPIGSLLGGIVGAARALTPWHASRPDFVDSAGFRHFAGADASTER